MDTITIRLENTFGAEAQATSASIMQVGSTFVIQQNVEIACTLPNSPIVASQFTIGPLAAGAYNVTANINFTGSGPVPCSPPPITQTVAFNVVAAASVPALDWVGLAVLCVALAVTGLGVLSAKS